MVEPRNRVSATNSGSHFQIRGTLGLEISGGTISQVPKKPRNRPLVVAGQRLPRAYPVSRNRQFHRLKLGKSCRFEESSNQKLAIQNQRLKPGRDPARWTKRQCLTPFKQTPRFLVWRVDRDTPIRTLNRHSRRLSVAVGASKRPPAVMPTYGDGCFVPRPQERGASFLSTQRHGARSRTPATFRNGWTAAHTRRIVKRELSHESEANVRARVRFFADPLRAH